MNGNYDFFKKIVPDHSTSIKGYEKLLMSYYLGKERDLLYRTLRKYKKRRNVEHYRDKIAEIEKKIEENKHKTDTLNTKNVGFA